jgi:hypothetical protein
LLVQAFRGLAGGSRVDDQPVPLTGFGQDVSRPRRVGFELAPELVGIHP